MSLHERVRHLLRTREPPVLSDRQAVAALRPYGQGVQASPASPPLTNNAPELATAGGALGEQEFGRVSQFTQ